MNSKLRKNEKCPIHNSYFCCGRNANRLAGKAFSRGVRKELNERRHLRKADWVQVAAGVWRIPDEHHPRGYRERRSPAAMRELLRKKVADQNKLCGICGELLDDYRETVPDHIEPRGMGGARRDDHQENIQAAHSACNLVKGSRRL